MSFAKLRYTPAGFSTVDIDFPEELSAWEGPIRNAERQVNETEAGVMMVHFGHFEEQCVAVLEKVPFSENFVNQVRAFWTHATRGGKFSFYRDGAKIGVTTIRAAAAAGSNLVLLNGFSFFAGHRVVLESAVDGWQQEACLVAVQNPSSPPSDQMTSPLIFDWLSATWLARSSPLRTAFW